MKVRPSRKFYGNPLNLAIRLETDIMIKTRNRHACVSRVIGCVVACVASFGTTSAVAADVERGADLFEQHCAACHTHIATVRDKSGPNLSGLIGRRAGSADYIHGYSDAMKSTGLTWDLGTLMAFITSPAGVVRGTNMVFRGLSDVSERADLLCYLRQATNQGVADPSLTDCSDL
jgi:cytochrome c